jgi:hypothetical protein
LCAQGVAAGHFDVVVLGGTLGILLAAALLAHSSSHSGQGTSQPLRVAVVERGELVGRDQEWNCTQADLQVMYGLQCVMGGPAPCSVLTDTEWTKARSL